MPCKKSLPFAAPVQKVEFVDILKITPGPPVAIMTASPRKISRRLLNKFINIMPQARPEWSVTKRTNS